MWIPKRTWTRSIELLEMEAYTDNKRSIMTTLPFILSVLFSACAPSPDHGSTSVGDQADSIATVPKVGEKEDLHSTAPEEGVALNAIEPVPAGPSDPTAEAPEAPSGFDHAPWEKLLQKHVDAAGMVNYAAIGKDPAFAAYLKQLAAAQPSGSWSTNERKAFWINAYNACTIKLIVDHPGAMSIKDIDSPWKTKFFSIGGVQMDLDHIEHIELRKNLKDPRIHFGIVCASFSCPQLWNHAYTAAALDKQLDDAARRFINDPLRNKITAGNVELSRIFDWFKGDFTDGQSLIAFLNRYAGKPIALDAEVDFLDYDWRLNAQ